MTGAQWRVASVLLNEQSERQGSKATEDTKSGGGERGKATKETSPRLPLKYLLRLPLPVAFQSTQRDISVVWVLADLLCFTAPANSFAWENLFLVSMDFTATFFSTSFLFSGESPTLLRLLCCRLRVKLSKKKSNGRTVVNQEKPDSHNPLGLQLCHVMFGLLIFKIMSSPLFLPGISSWFKERLKVTTEGEDPI